MNHKPDPEVFRPLWERVAKQYGTDPDTVYTALVHLTSALHPGGSPAENIAGSPEELICQLLQRLHPPAGHIPR